MYLLLFLGVMNCSGLQAKQTYPEWFILYTEITSELDNWSSNTSMLRFLVKPLHF